MRFHLDRSFLCHDGFSSVVRNFTYHVGHGFIHFIVGHIRHRRYHTLREKDGLDVLRENLGDKVMDFGNYRKYQQELEGLNKILDDGVITSE